MSVVQAVSRFACTPWATASSVNDVLVPVVQVVEEIDI